MTPQEILALLVVFESADQRVDARTAPVVDPMTTATTDRLFDELISTLDEPLHCQTDQTSECHNRATWLAIRHQPCGYKLLCSFHLHRWLRRVAERADRYYPTCSVCHQYFETIDEFAGLCP